MISFYEKKNFDSSDDFFNNFDSSKILDNFFDNEENSSCQLMLEEYENYKFKSNNILDEGFVKDNDPFSNGDIQQLMEDELDGTKFGQYNGLSNLIKEKESEDEKHNISEENTSQNSKTNTENTLTDNSSNSSNSKTTKEIIFTITKDAKVKRVPIIPQEPEIELEQEQEKETPKLLGQKQERTHTKYSFDNLVRKIKSKLFASILLS